MIGAVNVMALVDWKTKPDEIMREVRLILQAEGHPNASRQDCVQWVRGFVRRYIPGWAGEPFEPEIARLIGGSFGRHVARARRELRRRKFK